MWLVCVWASDLGPVNLSNWTDVEQRPHNPDLKPLYEQIYNKKDRSYFETLEKKAEELAEKHKCRFVDNETPYERVPQGHPIIVDYFYHEEVRGTENSGKRNKQ